MSLILRSAFSTCFSRRREWRFSCRVSCLLLRGRLGCLLLVGCLLLLRRLPMGCLPLCCLLPGCLPLCCLLLLVAC